MVSDGLRAEEVLIDQEVQDLEHYARLFTVGGDRGTTAEFGSVDTRLYEMSVVIVRGTFPENVQRLRNLTREQKSQVTSKFDNLKVLFFENVKDYYVSVSLSIYSVICLPAAM